jgi:hypothetical protein
MAENTITILISRKISNLGMLLQVANNEYQELIQLIQQQQFLETQKNSANNKFKKGD